jgi:hypothetical protein
MKRVRYIPVLPGMKIRLPDLKVVYATNGKVSLVQVKAINIK